MGLSLVVLGRNLEGDDFWHGIDIRHVDAAADLRTDAAVIVQPSLWETHPSSLVRRALALGIPVITTPGTGLGEREGVKTVPFGDADALKAALRSFSETRAIQ